MLVVAVVAIIVVGPKDLPGMLRTVGKSVKKIRGMAGDFQRQFDDALKEAELDGVKKSFDDVKSMNPLNQVKDSLNPLKDMADDIKKDIDFNDDDGEDDPGQVDDEEYSGFDPEKLFDETKFVKVSEPVKVDVDAALAKEKAKTAKSGSAKKSKSKSTRKPAAKAPAAKTKSKPVKTAAVAKKPTASKTVAKKAATKKPAVKKPAAKPRKSAPKKAKSA